jgi:hypothetical protein
MRILLSSLAVLAVFAAISSNPASARPACCASANQPGMSNSNIVSGRFSEAVQSTSGGIVGQNGRVITNGAVNRSR